MTIQKNVVVVLGMHRSGTSAMTKGLEALGVSLSENLIEQGAGNEKGFWEDKDVLAINEKLLAHAGLTWRSPTPFPTELLDSQYVQVLKGEAVALVNNKVAEYACWGFKDPRTARLLSFWLQVFEAAEVTPKFLVALRNPLDVARSLEKRDALTHEHSYLLWLMHTLPNLPLLGKHSHVLLDFADLLSKPNEELARVSEALDLPLDAQKQHQFCNQYLDNSMCHSQTSVTDLMDDEAQFPLVSEAYLQLLTVARDKGQLSTWLDSEGHNALQKGYAEYVFQKTNTVLEASEQQLFEAKLKLNAESLSYQHEKNLAEQEAVQQVAITERYRHKLEALERKYIEQKIALRDLKQQSDEESAALAEAQHLLHETRLQLQAAYTSTSWKLSAPVRVAKRALTKPISLTKKVHNGVQTLGGYTVVASRVKRILQQEGVKGLKHRFHQFNQRTGGSLGTAVDNPHVLDYPTWVSQFGEVTPQREKQCLETMAKFERYPVISILMPVYNAPEKYLREAFDSIIDQTYPYWELCLADDCSTEPYIQEVLQEYAAKDERIKVVFREENGHISAATNSALEVATGEYLALMDNDDLLPKDALFWIANEINEHPNAALIFSDEDKITEDGQTRFDPYFKSSWNPELFLRQNCLSHIGVYRTDIARKIDGFAIGMEGSQDWDFALRFSEQIDPEQIRHIPRILYHWRAIPGSTAVAGDEKPYALLAGQRAVQSHLDRCGIDATANLHESLPFVDVRYNVPEAAPKVSLIIPTRNGYDILKVCLDSIYQKTTYQNFEVILVDNGSDCKETLAYLEEMAAKHENFTVLRDDSPFNYSALNNKAVEVATGEYIALVNNDIEVITPEWLDLMVSHAIQPGVGAVGARLWYPDMTLQHGGVILVRGVASHAHKYLPQNAPGYFGRAMLTQNFVAVTAACLVVKKSVFQEVGGLNEQDLKVAFNDIDFCLKVFSAGYKNVWVAGAELIHHESKTRGFEDTPEKQARFNKEVGYMQSTWQHLIDNDPYFNLNLNNFDEDFSIAAMPRVEY